MNKKNGMTMVSLRDGLIDTFSLKELDNLCFDLAIRFESLPGDTIDAKAKELVDFCHRRRRLPDLVDRLIKLRPAVAWQVPVDAPVIKSDEPDAALVVGCQEMAVRIVDRTLAISGTLSSKYLAMTTVPQILMADLIALDAGIEKLITQYHDANCGQLLANENPILRARRTEIERNISQLNTQKRQFGIQIPLALRRNVVQAQVQLALLDVLQQVL